MNNYKKIEIVGKGSFGYAVLVQSVLDGNYYIMKIIDVLKMDRKQREEALNEVTFLKALRHPFIITYRESFMDKNRYLCIVMDYADGGDMYSKIAKQKKLGKGFSESQILDWFVQICLALKYVHDRKILHRDLKTQNIFLTSKGEIKIGDFGIARVLQSTYDFAQTAIGTPYYLSPEICQEKPYNQKSDIWSLGCILYEIITLKHAFDATSMKALVFKILRGTYPEIPKMYSQELRDVIAEMLTKEASKRPSIKKILEKDFLASRIPKLVANTLNNRGDMSHTILKKGTNVSSSLSSNNGVDSSNNINELTKIEEKKILDEKVLNEKNLNVMLTANREVSREKKQTSKELEIFFDEDKNVVSIEKSLIAEKTRENYFQKKENLFLKDKKEKLPSEERKNNIENNKPTAAQQKVLFKPPMNKSKKEEIDEREEKLKNLIISTKELVKNGGSNSNKKRDSLKECHEIQDEEIFYEEEDKRVFSKFLTFEGNAIPGISDKDSISYRIETLRLYLENQLGEELFIKTYQYLQDNALNDEDKSNSELVQIIGNENMKFIPLIFQLIVCEDSYYGGNNK